MIAELSALLASRPDSCFFILDYSVSSTTASTQGHSYHSGHHTNSSSSAGSSWSAMALVRSAKGQKRLLECVADLLTPRRRGAWAFLMDLPPVSVGTGGNDNAGPMGDARGG